MAGRGGVERLGVHHTWSGKAFLNLNLIVKHLFQQHQEYDTADPHPSPSIYNLKPPTQSPPQDETKEKSHHHKSSSARLQKLKATSSLFCSR